MTLAAVGDKVAAGALITIEGEIDIVEGQVIGEYTCLIRFRRGSPIPVRLKYYRPTAPFARPRHLDFGSHANPGLKRSFTVTAIWEEADEYAKFDPSAIKSSAPGLVCRPIAGTEKVFDSVKKIQTQFEVEIADESLSTQQQFDATVSIPIDFGQRTMWVDVPVKGRMAKPLVAAPSSVLFLRQADGRTPAGFSRKVVLRVKAPLAKKAAVEWSCPHEWLKVAFHPDSPDPTRSDSVVVIGHLELTLAADAPKTSQTAVSIKLRDGEQLSIPVRIKTLSN